MLKIMKLSKNGCINEGEISTRLGLRRNKSPIAEKIIIERDLSL